MKASTILFIMSRRLKMQSEGTTNPPILIKKYTKQLVEKLSLIDSEEDIDIINNEFMSAQIIRISTGELIAEVNNENT